MTDDVAREAAAAAWNEYSVRHGCVGVGAKWACFGDGFDRGVEYERARAAEQAKPDDEIDRRMREGRQLLRRMVKYVREDRAETPGNTRLARLTDSVDDYLRRTHRASDALRGDDVAKPEPEARGVSPDVTGNAIHLFPEAKPEHPKHCATVWCNRGEHEGAGCSSVPDAKPETVELLAEALAQPHRSSARYCSAHGGYGFMADCVACSANETVGQPGYSPPAEPEPLQPSPLARGFSARLDDLIDALNEGIEQDDVKWYLADVKASEMIEAFVLSELERRLAVRRG